MFLKIGQQVHGLPANKYIYTYDANNNKRHKHIIAILEVLM
jgi:hypothetical protein